MSWIVVKDLPEHLDEKEVSSLFSFGEHVTENILLRSDNGKIRPVAFVGFEKHTDAAHACTKLNHKTVRSIPVQAEIARPAVISQYAKLVPINGVTNVKKSNELNDPVLAVRRAHNRIFMRTTSNEFSLEFEKPKTKETISLGEALKQKVSSQKYSASNPPKRQLLKSQVVATNLVKTVASAGTPARISVLKKFKTEESREETHLRQVWSEEQVMGPVAFARIINGYMRCGKKAKDLIRASENPGLARLPSASFAAATVARCLIEIARGRVGCVIPFIDILGVVSLPNRAIHGYLRKFAGKFEVTQSEVVSIIGILNQKETLQGMQAALVSIPDLPEFEIVRAAQCAVRIRRSCVALREKLGGSRFSRTPPDELTGYELKSWTENEHVITKVHRLLLKCVVTPVDQTGLMKGFKSVTIDDVKHLLDYFAIILSAHSTRNPLGFENEIRSLLPGAKHTHYRGTENWMDRGFNSRSTENQELQGCMQWTCSLLDVHMSSLLVDTESCQLLSIFLKHVLKQRESSESVTSVLGALEHLGAGISVPKEELEYERYEVDLETEF